MKRVYHVIRTFNKSSVVLDNSWEPGAAPIEFRDVLMAMARSARKEAA